MRGNLTRRQLLGTAGVGGAALLASACGATAPVGVSGSGTPSPRVQADRSAAEKLVKWSNWLLYIDMDDKAGTRPSIDNFTRETGIAVEYTEDVNDNYEFFAKVRSQLEQGQDIGRDIVVLTDFMVGIWIANGFVEKLDKAAIPNAKNLLPKYQDVPFDPGRQYSLPWTSYFGCLGWNKAKLKELTGWTGLTSVDQLWDPRLHGRVTVLSEMHDTMTLIMASQGNDPTDFTDDQFYYGIDALTKQVDSGQIRQVTGNDYAGALESGDVVAVIGWSGDIIQLGDDFGVALPDAGGSFGTDNMLIPAMAAHKANAEAVMNYYYDPEVAAEVAAYVQYITPVHGAREAMTKVDPSLVDNQWIFPSEETMAQGYVFMPVSDAQTIQYEEAFQKAIGN